MQIKSAIDIGRLIRLSRQQKNWSQSQLAAELGTSQRWVSEIENGKSRAELGRVLKCLRVLGVALDAKIDITPQKLSPSGPIPAKHGSAGQPFRSLRDHIQRPDIPGHDDEASS